LARALSLLVWALAFGVLVDVASAEEVSAVDIVRSRAHTGTVS
jgi:hypothetical protein